MKFNVLFVLLTVGVLFSSGAHAGDREELENAASDAAVVQALESPDGCALKLDDPENWKLICMGSASYHFNDADERKDATTEATLDAKASLTRFMNEKLSVSNSVETIVNKNISQTTGADKKVSKESMKTSISSIVNSANAILKGVITLESTANWGGSDGVVRVKIGQSAKTMAAAGHFRSQNRSADKSNSSAGSESGASDEESSRKRKSDSDF
jgi:hypothetical protein